MPKDFRLSDLSQTRRLATGAPSTPEPCSGRRGRAAAGRSAQTAAGQASAIHAAEDDKSLANVLMDSVCRGTGLPNAAVLRALDAAGRIEIVASRLGPTLHEPTAMGFSRSLLTTASQGVLAEMSATSSGDFSQSIIRMNVDAAICVPLMLGSTVAA